MGWAKAAPGAPPAATAADRREFLEGGLRPFACGQCGNRVLVKKNSLAHTSVQWVSDSANCPELATRMAAGELSARVDGCATLRASIAAAVADGTLEVGQ